jgi:hypothetical protein
MPDRIRFSDIEQISDPVSPSSDSAAPRLDGGSVSVRCVLAATDASTLEALRYARRAMLREEWTRGIEEGEPSLEDAVFSAHDVSWQVREEERERCLQKLDELLRRANRALHELSAVPRG